MSIQRSTVSTDIEDKKTRELGEVSISDNYQDEYLPLILVELRRISLILAEIGSLDINDFEIDDEEVDL